MITIIESVNDRYVVKVDVSDDIFDEGERTYVFVDFDELVGWLRRVLGKPKPKAGEINEI